MVGGQVYQLKVGSIPNRGASLIFADSFSALICVIGGKRFLFFLPLISLISADVFSALFCVICGKHFLFFFSRWSRWFSLILLCVNLRYQQETFFIFFSRWSRWFPLILFCVNLRYLRETFLVFSLPQISLIPADSFSAWICAICGKHFSLTQIPQINAEKLLGFTYQITPSL